jgi:hypothetical protein
MFVCPIFAHKFVSVLFTFAKNRLLKRKNFGESQKLKFAYEVVNNVSHVFYWSQMDYGFDRSLSYFIFSGASYR